MNQTALLFQQALTGTNTIALPNHMVQALRSKDTISVTLRVTFPPKSWG
jgi:hypothetical protein